MALVLVAEPVGLPVAAVAVITRVIRVLAVVEARVILAAVAESVGPEIRVAVGVVADPTMSPEAPRPRPQVRAEMPPTIRIRIISRARA